MDERFIFEFIKPFQPKVPWNKWHLVVGGWEVSGENKEELEKEAIRLLERELKRLKK